MVSIDLKDASLQIPVHPDSRQLLRFVAFWVPYEFKALCFGLSTGHGSSFRDASSSRDPDAPVPRRLASPCVVSDRCSVSEGRSPFSLLRPWDIDQPSQVSSCSDLVCHLSGDVHIVSNFEGFSLSGEGFRPADADRRVSVLQAAKRLLLVQSAQPFVVPLSVSSRGSSPDVVLTAGSSLQLGLHR